MSARAIWRRAALVLLCYLALLVAWPVLRLAYAPAFRALGEFAVGVVDPLDGAIQAVFVPDDQPGFREDVPKLDTRVLLKHREMPGADGMLWASSYFHGFSATALVLALFAMATPLSWKPRMRRLGWAALLLFVFVALRCVVGVYYIFTKSMIAGKPIVDLSPLANGALYWTWHFLWQEPLANLIVPILIWIVCTLPGNAGERDAPQGAA